MSDLGYLPRVVRRGVTFKGVLLAMGVLVAAAAILFGVARTALGESDVLADARRMRQIYVALSIYETEHDNWPAPNLLAVRRDLGDDTTLRATNDPFTTGTSFPIDPSLPSLRGRSPTRISFAYLGDWVRAGAVRLKPWAEARNDVRQGLLASWWYGTIPLTDPTGAHADGGVLRVNVDGAVTRLPKRRDPNRLTYDDLFRNR